MTHDKSNNNIINKKLTPNIKKKLTPNDKTMKEDKDISSNDNMSETLLSNNKMSLENFDINKIIAARIKSLRFITDNSKDISYKLIKFAQSCIKRSDAILKFTPILVSIKKAIELERGIFEFALVHVTLHSLDYNNVTAIYRDKIHDLCINLDETSNMNNKTLKPSIIAGDIKPQILAFLSPQQLHPANWADINNKKKFVEDVEHNMATTDLYKCKKCGERKCRVSQMQMRSADEPMTSFIICLVCYSTFCK
jgi:DNA-directed RNA polymerase subunit M/transcription elongation factor TFIIS